MEEESVKSAGEVEGNNVVKEGSEAERTSKGEGEEKKRVTKKEEDSGDEEEDVYNAVIKVSPSDVEVSSEEGDLGNFDDFDDDEGKDKTVVFDGSGGSDSDSDSSEDDDEEEDTKMGNGFYGDVIVKTEGLDLEEMEELLNSTGEEEEDEDRNIKVEGRKRTRSGRKIAVGVVKKEKKDKPKKAPRPKIKKERVKKEKGKRGRKKQPRRLDGREDVTSEEEDDGGEDVPIRVGSNYHVLFKRKVLKYASTHSNSATAEKFNLKAKLVREWRKNKEKIEMEAETPAKKRTRNDGYTVEEKLHAIAFAAERSTAEARLLYNVDKRTIEKWKAKKDRLEKRLMEGDGKAIREVGSGCKPKYTHIEAPLRDWIVGLRLRNITVNVKMILAHANKLYRESPTEGEKKHKGPRSATWVVNFLKRHNLYHLIGTTLGHEDPRELLSVGVGHTDVSSLVNKIDEIPENPNKRHRRRITLDDKLSIIRRIENGETQGTVAKSLHVATSTIQTIWSCRHQIVQRSLAPAPEKPKSLTLFWRKYSVIASALQDWYEQCLQSKIRVDAKALTDKAMQLSETYRLDEFRSESTEWLKIYCKRRDLKEVLTELLGIPSQSQQQSLSSSAPPALAYHPPRHNHHNTADAPYTPNSTVANASECDNDDSSNFHEAEQFNFDEFMNPNGQVQSRQPSQSHFLEQSSSSSTHHNHHSHSHHHQNTSSSTTAAIFNSSSSATPVIINSHLLTPVPLLEAMKCVGTLRSWIVGNFGAGNIELNNHLTAIENAVAKKRKELNHL